MSEQVHWFMDLSSATCLPAHQNELVNRRPPGKDGADITSICAVLLPNLLIVIIVSASLLASPLTYITTNSGWMELPLTAVLCSSKVFVGLYQSIGYGASVAPRCVVILLLGFYFIGTKKEIKGFKLIFRPLISSIPLIQKNLLNISI
jgi:hypothetical protein